VAATHQTREAKLASVLLRPKVKAASGTIALTPRRQSRAQREEEVGEPESEPIDGRMWVAGARVKSQVLFLAGECLCGEG
jgi:hypothetical protein